ncbi:MAG: hypothetical protein BGP10_11220 [Rhodanobacter sp. 68-29]|nr:DUF4124 domain-containing protein [Rhodanobacter sp.]ODU76110.1 MAG: hypothetical protein ABT17_01480 [Rhodanobacter sp. SCN 69-32]OJY62325.1 MAG: hypothetical protein BGP10_11220 [Rhodanobacter sp. 68-29]
MSRSLIAVALLLVAPLLAAQQIYKWTDAKGTVHYSQSAPPEGTRFQQVKLTGGVEAPAGTTEQPRVENTPPPADTPAPAPMTDTPANRAKLCATLKSNLATLQGTGPVVMQQGGKPAVLSDDQRKQQVATANAQFQQYCSGQ